VVAVVKEDITELIAVVVEDITDVVAGVGDGSYRGGGVGCGGLYIGSSDGGVGS
jgi:hypothetical protein